MSEGFGPLRLYRVASSGRGVNMEVGPVVLALAFAAEALAPTLGGHHCETIGDVAEIVRPTPAVMRTIEELQALGLSLSLVGDFPGPVLTRIAQVLWFPGHTVPCSDPVRGLTETLEVPSACIWFVTAKEGEAQRAVLAGMNAIALSPDAPATTIAPSARGYYVAAGIEDVLEIIRVPYTRTALAMRVIAHTLVRREVATEVTP